MATGYGRWRWLMADGWWQEPVVKPFAIAISHQPSAIDTDKYLPTSADQPADSLRHRFLLERAVGDAEVAAVGQAERGAGNHGDAMLANQPLRHLHRIGVGVHPQETVEGAVGRRHRAQRLER